jgi:hypothetical protein
VPENINQNLTAPRQHEAHISLIEIETISSKSPDVAYNQEREQQGSGMGS